MDPGFFLAEGQPPSPLGGALVPRHSSFDFGAKNNPKAANKAVNDKRVSKIREDDKVAPSLASA